MNIEFSEIRAGDKVRFNVYAGMGRNGKEYSPKTGKAVMRGPAGWVVNGGGPHGTPYVVSLDNFISARRSK